jgi:hypothetical protein
MRAQPVFRNNTGLDISICETCSFKARNTVEQIGRLLTGFPISTISKRSKISYLTVHQYLTIFSKSVLFPQLTCTQAKYDLQFPGYSHTLSKIKPAFITLFPRGGNADTSGILPIHTSAHISKLCTDVKRNVICIKSFSDRNVKF